MSELRKRIIKIQHCPLDGEKKEAYGVYAPFTIESLILAETKELRQALSDMTEMVDEVYMAFTSSEPKILANAKRVLEKYS